MCLLQLCLAIIGRQWFLTLNKMKIPEQWYIKTEEHSSGDLYELVENKTFYVFHKNSKKPVYTFKGTYEAVFDGGGWKQTYATGVYSVNFNEKQTALIVKYYDDSIDKINLKTGK